METLKRIMTRMPISTQESGCKLRDEEYMRQKADAYNALSGSLSGCDCKKCSNKGNYIVLKYNNGRYYEAIRECECMRSRKSFWHIIRSGLLPLVNNRTFETFKPLHSWQNKMLQSAQNFIKSGSLMFYIGGQSGSGKTHICVAIVNEFLKQFKQVRFMSWTEESTKLKSLVNNALQYEDFIKDIKTAEILYIDDLFKSEAITPADKKLIFEILNYRYNNNLITIISSECEIASKDQNRITILKLDEAIGGRIIELAGEFCLNIEKSPEKNYRLKNLAKL